MTFDIAEIVGQHPRITMLAVLTLLLAGVGTWYVIQHHLKLILVTVLCGFGFFAGGLVIYRGSQDPVLVGVGLFLLVTFPLIWMRSIWSQSAAAKKPAPAAPQTLAGYELELRPKQPPAAQKDPAGRR